VTAQDGHGYGAVMIVKDELQLTEAVLAETGRADDPRFKEIVQALVRHLHDFARPFRESVPQLGALVLASDGNFYGLTVSGGTGCGTAGCGTLYRITPSGTLTVVYTFPEPGTIDYASPGLIQGTNGDLYGETGNGGQDYGTVFSLALGLAPLVEAR